MAARSKGRLVVSTIVAVFALLFLVLPAQEILGQEIARLALFGVAYLAARRIAVVRGVSVADLGWVRPTARSLTRGIGLGIALVCAVVAVSGSFGWYSLEWAGSWSGFGWAVLHAIAVGLYEEAVFRSVWFGGLEPAIGTWMTLALSAIVFGLLHSFNPGATLLSSVSVALTGGLLLGVIFVVWRNVWMVAATHAAWNATLGGFFGMPVSGSSPSSSVFSARETGPDIWTGGAFGPEASLLTILLVGGAALGILAQRRRFIATAPRAVGGSRI